MPNTNYELAYKKKSLEFIETLNKKTRAQIVNHIDKLVTNPYPHHSRQIRMNSGVEHKIYRIRSGDYRILYYVPKISNKIIIVDVNHRKEIYRRRN